MIKWRAMIALWSVFTMGVGAAPLTIPAAAFSDVGKAKHGNGFLSFREQTEAKVAVKIPVPGDYDVVLVARGDSAYGESARLRFSVDGATVSEVDTQSGVDWRTHTFPVTLMEGERLLSVRFVNDLTDGQSGESRNAYLYSVTLLQREDVPGLDMVNSDAFQIVETRRKERVLEDAARAARKIRTGSVVVQVVNDRGGAVENAKVTFESVEPIFTLGTSVSGKAFRKSNPAPGHVAYKTKISELFNEVIPADTLKWKAMEPRDGDPRTEQLDAIIAWAKEQGLLVRGHPLFWSCPERIQRWVKDLDDDLLQIRMEQRIVEVTDSYPDLAEYGVMNEMLHCSYFVERLGDDIRPRVFKLVQQAAPQARLYVNDYNVLNGLKVDEFMVQIEELLLAGAPIGGIGLQAHLNEEVDITTIRHVLDQLGILKLPVKITELEVVAETDEEQARILDDVLRVAYGHPSVHGVALWGFWESLMKRKEAALFRKDFAPKPAGEVLQKFVEEWRPAFVKKTGELGLVDDYLTFGTCKVSVKKRGYETEAVEFVHAENPNGDPKRLTIVLKKK